MQNLSEKLQHSCEQPKKSNLIFGLRSKLAILFLTFSLVACGDASVNFTDPEDAAEQIPDVEPPGQYVGDAGDDDSRIQVLPEFPLSDELEVTPVYLQSENITVIVPEGYEALGEKHIEDLRGCKDKIPPFVGRESFWNNVVLKIYISNDGRNRGSYGGGILKYKRTQDNIDMDLSDVVNNHPDGFLFDSGPDYCANTHEFTHLVVDRMNFLAGWANEGIASYSQKHNQPGSMDEIECREDGWFGGDPWGDGQEKLFPYSDLSEGYDTNVLGDGPKWYHTAMCFWELFDLKFTDSKRREIFSVISYGAEYDTNIILRERMFLDNLIANVSDQEEIKALLLTFGFEEGVDYGDIE